MCIFCKKKKFSFSSLKLETIVFDLSAGLFSFGLSGYRHQTYPVSWERLSLFNSYLNFYFRQIVDKAPTPSSYVLLGDAYMAIQEPERALEIYEQAVKRNPRDSQLAAKMGQALQKTHQYGKAINYYKEAVKNEDNNNLRYDMAELQMKLKQFEKAERTISQVG